MSKNLNTLAVKLFEKEAIQSFQEVGGKLKNYVRLRDCKGASQVQFQVLGELTTSERTAIQTPLPTVDAAYTKATATVKRYTVSELTDIFDNSETGVDERMELIEAMKMSLDRRIDQMVIDALDAHSFTNTVAKNISGSADNLNVAMLVEASRLLGSKVPEQDRVLVCHDDGYHHLINEADVKSSDFNLSKPLVKGQLPHYYGFDICKMADRSEGGLALSTNDRTNYAFQKQALGLAMNIQPKIEVNYSHDYGAWRVSAFVSGGAVVIQDSGVVKITSDES